GYAIACMVIVIGLYDQLLFRPLVAGSARFRVEEIEAEIQPRSWMLRLLQRAHAVRSLVRPISLVGGRVLTAGSPKRPDGHTPGPRARAIGSAAWRMFVGALIAGSAWSLFRYARESIGWDDLGEALLLGLFTLSRVVALVALASIVWVPVGVHVGLRPRLAEKVQPLIQFLAAFPANLLFPFAVLWIVRFDLTPGIWLSPLMILGTQWYILFNVIAGTMAFPADLRQAADNLGVRGWRWWWRVILPGIFPYYVTGAITASGGSWNASIVAEVARWGDTVLVTRGLGAYIEQATEKGDYPRIVLGIVVMAAFVTAFYRLVWRPMYAYAERRLRIG
ncbi:MAG TPA: ABC transporter permease subunit, partial [Vulgatibacter sp.]